VQTLLYVVQRKLPPDLAVTARLLLPGEPVNGLQVPAAAVLRYQGLGWVYVQTDTNQFVRVVIPLDRPWGAGWFVGDNLAATNRIVVTGAQSVLSAELSGGGFTTGERD
jgi:multidrug efflux pump subunit AcrA (membrane-fusion protein)